MNEEVNPPAAPVEPAQAPATPAAPAGGLTLTGEKDARMVAAAGVAAWNIQLKSAESVKRKVKIKINLTITGVEGAAEWQARISDAVKMIWESGTSPEVELNLEGTKAKDLVFELQAPKGVRYGEGAKAEVEACFLGAPTICDRMEFTATARQSMVALKASIGHERQVADDVASKAKAAAAKSGIYAILSPTTLRGYVLIEGMNTDELKETVRGIRRARGLVEGETSFAEIDHFLTPKPLVSGIMEGDVVELIAGPFKGEKARVKHIDEAKEEITVELFEAMVPIPVTVRGDHVRVLGKEK
jgi:transcriptional antiterminator NusG